MFFCNFKKVTLLMLTAVCFVFACSCEKKSVEIIKSNKIEACQDTEGANFVSLEWKPVKDAENYKIYVFDESTSKYEFYKETSACYAAVGELSPSTKYKVKIEADGKNKSQCVINVATQPDSVNTPEVLQRGVNSVILQWNSVDDVDGYDIFVYDDKKMDYVYLASTNANVAEVFGLSSAKLHKIAVCPYILSGEYKARGDLSSVEAYTDCASPTDVSVSDRTSESYTIKWSESEKADGYDVCVYDPETKSYYEYKNNLTETQFSVSGLKNGDVRKYMITPYMIIGGEKYKSSDSAYVNAATLLKAVKVTSQGFINGLSVKWTINKYADGYNVYYSDAKDGDYTFVAKVDKTKTTYNISGLTKEGKYFVKVVPFKVSSNVTFEGEVAISSGYAYRNDHNEILSSYKQSSSITVTNSDFVVSESRKNQIMNLINNYKSTNKSSFVIMDIRSGAMISYNADWYVPTASTVKAPYICYVLTEEIDKGNASMDDILVYKEEFYDADGSGDIRFHEFGSKYTVKEVIEYILYYSDNVGYRMLQDHFGVENYNKWLKSLGCKTFVNGTSTKWGFVSARDSAKIWTEIYRYMYTGKYGDFFKKELLTTGYSPIRKNLGHLYDVANKFGGATVGWHDTGIVFKGDNPYILILLTDDSFEHADYNFQNGMIKQLNALHDELVEFNNK